MAGRRRRERLLSLLPLALALVAAPTPSLHAQGPRPTPWSVREFGPGGGPGAYPGVPPGRQAVFQRNLARWQAMSPQEQDFLRQRYQQRLQVRRQQAQRAFAESGLRLDDEGRGRYVRRYVQERRRLERELRRAAEAERTRRLPEIHERLRREFDPGMVR